MTLEQVVIGLIRLASALPVLRWPLAGALVAIAADLSDLFWMEVLDLGGVPGYQRFDKFLDLGYMATFGVVALRWRGLEGGVAVGLVVFRLVGLVAYAATGERVFLLAFPNVFEFWFVLVAARRHLRAEAMGPAEAGRWLLVLTLAKGVQEYVLHGWRGLDRYGFFEFFEVLLRTLPG